MTALSGQAPRIGPVGHQTAADALRLVLAGLPAEQAEEYVRSLMVEIGSGSLSLEGLFEAGCDLLARCDVCIASALLSTVTPEDDTVLRAAGFSPLASLLYLACEGPAFPGEQPLGPLEFEPWSPG